MLIQQPSLEIPAPDQLVIPKEEFGEWVEIPNPADLEMFFTVAKMYKVFHCFSQAKPSLDFKGFLTNIDSMYRVPPGRMDKVWVRTPRLDGAILEYATTL